MAKTSPQEAARLIAVADGAQGAAGHRVTDPAAREIIRRQAAGEITGDEARALLIAAAQAKNEKK
ncbi:hypothetical protein [Cryobacterium zhongshanensis]|uniref:Antitoxin VbhA domain-containing protein n=1 Tax=Cryobacterium zhongshanensis TaxID=2928153 RepID=A0AA41R2P7_9MICO|nr:hypothetical protein [Cryobacterium zhongshanensis]MCI4659731.1 hypothetical protein [Cryobacterium zhongshanensis]